MWGQNKYMPRKKKSEESAPVEEKIETFFTNDPENEPVESASMAAAKETKAKAGRLSKLLVYTFIFGIIAGLGGTAFYFRQQYKTNLQKQAVETKNEIQDVLASVGKLMELPGGEEPKLATVTDKEKLQGQAFFAQAQNGDRVLLYLNAKKAILYRPSNNKIIDMTVLSDSGMQPEGDSSAEVQQPATEGSRPEAEAPKTLRIAVYNGTNIKGLASQIADKLGPIASIEVVEKSNAKGSFDKNIVVDLTGQSGSKVEEIMKLIGGESGTLPEGEQKPEADILIIGGQK